MGFKADRGGRGIFATDEGGGEGCPQSYRYSMAITVKISLLLFLFTSRVL